MEEASDAAAQLQNMDDKPTNKTDNQHEVVPAAEAPPPASPVITHEEACASEAELPTTAPIAAFDTPEDNGFGHTPASAEGPGQGTPGGPNAAMGAALPKGDGKQEYLYLSHTFVHQKLRAFTPACPVELQLEINGMMTDDVYPGTLGDSTAKGFYRLDAPPRELLLNKEIFGLRLKADGKIILQIKARKRPMASDEGRRRLNPRVIGITTSIRVDFLKSCFEELQEPRHPVHIKVEINGVRQPELFTGASISHNRQGSYYVLGLPFALVHGRAFVAWRQLDHETLELAVQDVDPALMAASMNSAGRASDNTYSAGGGGITRKGSTAGIVVDSRISIPLAMLKRDLGDALPELLPGGLGPSFEIPIAVKYRVDGELLPRVYAQAVIKKSEHRGCCYLNGTERIPVKSKVLSGLELQPGNKMVILEFLSTSKDELQRRSSPLVPGAGAGRSAAAQAQANAMVLSPAGAGPAAMSQILHQIHTGAMSASMAAELAKALNAASQVAAAAEALTGGKGAPGMYGYNPMSNGHVGGTGETTEEEEDYNAAPMQPGMGPGGYGMGMTIPSLYAPLPMLQPNIETPRTVVGSLPPGTPIPLATPMQDSAGGAGRKSRPLRALADTPGNGMGEGGSKGRGGRADLSGADDDLSGDGQPVPRGKRTGARAGGADGAGTTPRSTNGRPQGTPGLSGSAVARGASSEPTSDGDLTELPIDLKWSTRKKRSALQSTQMDGDSMLGSVGGRSVGGRSSKRMREGDMGMWSNGAGVPPEGWDDGTGSVMMGGNGRGSMGMRTPSGRKGMPMMPGATPGSGRPRGMPAGYQGMQPAFFDPAHTHMSVMPHAGNGNGEEEEDEGEEEEEHAGMPAMMMGGQPMSMMMPHQGMGMEMQPGMGMGYMDPNGVVHMLQQQAMMPPHLMGSPVSVGRRGGRGGMPGVMVGGVPPGGVEGFPGQQAMAMYSPAGPYGMGPNGAVMHHPYGAMPGPHMGQYGSVMGGAVMHPMAWGGGEGYEEEGDDDDRAKEGEEGEQQENDRGAGGDENGFEATWADGQGSVAFSGVRQPGSARKGIKGNSNGSRGGRR